MARKQSFEVATKMALSYGTWPSPITADLVTRGAKRFDSLWIDGIDIYWNELRPFEGGRNVVVRYNRHGQKQDMTPLGYSVRSRVHEYGGGAFTAHKGTIFFVNDKDQRVYVQHPEQAPKPLTPEGFLFADLCYSNASLIAVCEEHHSPTNIENYLVSIDTQKGKFIPIVKGFDFYSSPTVSDDGKKLAWICWNHPNMPWDGSEVWVGDFVKGKVVNQRKIAGGPQISIFQPRWSKDGVLHYVSDETGWWNIYRETSTGSENLCPMEAEFGWPQWVFGLSMWDFVGDEILCIFYQKGLGHMGFLDPATKKLRVSDLDGNDFSQIHVGDGFAVCLQGSLTQSRSITYLDLQTMQTRLIASDEIPEISSRFYSLAELIEFPSAGGRKAYGFYYPPQSKDYRGPDGERPPLIVKSHGGPTASVSCSFDLKIQYWTSRGFAVLDVNYGGSSGYGRAYRELLKSNWGIVDVEDCEHGALYLVQKRKVDAEKLAITGGSAGGFTTLSALTFKNVFTAGASYYGVSDLNALARDTHKFESHYLDRLIGPHTSKKKLYESRSPITHVEKLSCPVIFFQGADDQVVPCSQTEAMYKALQKKGIPTKMIIYQGEQHGFRKAENIKDALEKELEFYLWIFGQSPNSKNLKSYKRE